MNAPIPKQYPAARDWLDSFPIFANLAPKQPHLKAAPDQRGRSTSHGYGCTQNPTQPLHGCDCCGAGAIAKHMRSRLYILTRLWIDLTREMHSIHRPHSPTRFNSKSADALICAAIYLSTVENRQITASKLADYIGQPRPSVLRRLAALEHDGLVERRGMSWRIPLKTMMRAERQKLASVSELVTRAADDLHRR